MERGCNRGQLETMETVTRADNTSVFSDKDEKP